MNSIWKNLLFLHGHVLHRDLAWRPDPQTSKRPSPARTQRLTLARCAAVWPRLIGPR